MNNAKYIIGIDPGTYTGIAVYDCERKMFVLVATLSIHRAMDVVKGFEIEKSIFVRVEDARLRNWFGKSGREKLQGAGSVKRDSKIWSDFLTDEGIPFELVAPKNNVTKISAEAFKKLTGYNGRTSEHGRDAAMLVWGYKEFKIEN
jgi:hypothetical protein